MNTHDDHAASQLTSDSAFFPVRRDLIEQMRPSLRYSGLACLIYLSSQIGNEEWVTASASKIGGACKLKTRTVFSALARLEKLGLIEHNNSGAVSAYRLWPQVGPDLAPAAPLAGSASSSESDTHTVPIAHLPAPEERSPSITERIADLLRQTYKACDIEEVKAACEYDDEQLLKKLLRLRQRGGVAPEMSFNFFITGLCSDD